MVNFQNCPLIGQVHKAAPHKFPGITPRVTNFVPIRPPRLPPKNLCQQNGLVAVAVHVAQPRVSTAAVLAAGTRTAARIRQTSHKHEHRTLSLLSLGICASVIDACVVGIDFGCGNGGTAYFPDSGFIEVVGEENGIGVYFF